MKGILFTLMLTGLALRVFAQTTVSDSMMFGGNMRHFRVYIPATRKCALIIHLHGYGSTGSLEQTFTNYMPVADTAGFLVAYPDGLKDTNGNQYWNVGWSFLPNTNDVGFLSALIDTLAHRYLIDPATVFVSGLSNGGFMCHKLACELSNKVAAIASVAGSMTMAEYSTCAPSRAVPVMEIHGTADVVVPYTGVTGTSDSQDLDSVVLRSAVLAGCSPIPVHTTLPHNAATTNGSSVDHYVYAGGAGGATCELYKINGGQHVEWAGVAGSFDFNASREIWRFFRAYRTSNCSNLSVHSVGDNVSVLAYPNPFASELTISLTGANVKEAVISLHNLLGQTVLSTALSTPVFHAKVINTTSLPNGIYYLQAVIDGTRTVRQLLKQ